MSSERRRREDQTYREWKGAYRPYDIVREATIALGVVLGLTVVHSADPHGSGSGEVPDASASSAA